MSCRHYSSSSSAFTARGVTVGPHSVKPRAITSGWRAMAGPYVACLSLLTFLGCSDDHGSQAPGSGIDTVGVTVMDSADVEVVTVDARMLDSLPEWSLSREPSLTIGEVAGDDRYLFGRIVGALRLQSGEIVVAEGVGLRLLFFGPDGVFRASVGREGEGPGDFMAISLWRLMDGGFAVGDDRLNRITLFDESGTLREVRTGACRSRGDSSMAALGIPRCYFEGVAGDSTVFWAGTRYAEGRPTLRPDVVTRYSGDVRFLAYDSGDTAAVVDSIRRADHVRISQLPPPGRVGAPFLWSFQELFSPDGYWAFGQHSVAVGESGRFEIRFRDTAGRLQRILRIVRPPESVTEAHVAAIRDAVGTPASMMTEEIGRKYLDEFDPGGLIPFFGELRFDIAGNLWISEYVPDEMLVIASERGWMVFDDAAMPLARITTEPLDDILEFGDDYLLVRERNELDVERVALYRIERE